MGCCFFFNFPEVRCLSHLQGNIKGPMECHRAGISIRPERVLGQQPVTITCIPQAPLLHFCSTKVFLSSTGQTTSVWLTLPQQEAGRTHGAWQITVTAWRITLQTKLWESPLTRIFFPFLHGFFPLGLSSVTKNTPYNSAAEQEPVAPAISVHLSQAFQGWSLNKALSMLCSSSHGISVQLC